MSFQNCKLAGVGVNPESYHGQEAERGTPTFRISPSSLRAFMECPARWKAGYESPESDAKDWGWLLDMLLLTPEQFKDRCVVKPKTYIADEKGTEKPWNMNAKVCQAWFAEQGDKKIVSSKDFAEAEKAVKRLLADETIKSFHDASDKQVHVTGEWLDETTGVIVPVQCLIDYAPRKDSEFQKSLGDLKSTRNANQRVFGRWCYTAGYHIQAAFDLALYTAATGEDRTDWIFILSENYAPYEIGRRLLGQQFLEIGRQTFEHALKRYAKCLKTGVWAGYDLQDEFSIISAEPWMEFSALSDALENAQEDALAAAANDDIIP